MVHDRIDTSVIVSVYNDIRWLELILAGLGRQQADDFEVVVADDGSTEALAEAVERARQRYAFPIRHVWHADRGWRKNAILNRAAANARGEYLIFIDGDCVPHPRFIAEHRLLRAPGQIAAGRRAQLPPGVSEALTPEGIGRGMFHRFLFWRTLWNDLFFSPRCGAEYFVRITPKWLRRAMKERTHGVLGCNMGIYKADLLRVNGFDERFEMPYIGEDTDLEARLRRVGIRVRVYNHIATLYHKWHRSQPRELTVNRLIFEENNRLEIGFTPYGIDKSHSR